LSHRHKIKMLQGCNAKCIWRRQQICGTMWLAMPTLDLPNLAAIRYQTMSQPAPIGPSQAAPPVPCSCQPGFNLCVEQGATLSSQIALTVKDSNGNIQPVDITGNKFEFTAKTDPNLPDTDPTVIKVDWTETKTPTQGTTWLVIPSDITVAMQLVPYFYQVRMVQSPTSPSPTVTPLFSGTLTVIQPVSSRSS
jgi:hypothetical protein